MTAHEWIIGNDTGTSSKSIWAVMMGVLKEPTRCGGKYNVPHDNSDFGRCYRLIKAIPEWRARLEEVALIFPAWAPIIREWDRLQRLFEAKANSTDLYNLLRTLGEESMLCDGWTKEGSSWRREGASKIELGEGVSISMGGVD